MPRRLRLPPQWTPYDGQLRLLAFSHLASGADMVEYWHWHSLHNACETYWKGVLSHDFGENRTYREAVAVGADFRRLGKHLIHLKKENKAAILVSNEALTGLNWFPLGDGRDYNDVVRWIYDALYQMNVECDFIFPEAENLSDYKVIFMPALYCASEALLRGLKDFVREGGVLVGTFKSCFANENVKVYSDAQPHILQECFGAAYDQFFTAEEMPLEVLLEKYSREDSEQTESARGFMECLRPQGARVLARYSHSNWGQYAAAVCNDFGRGAAYYLGCMCSSALLKRILKSALDRAEIKGNEGSSGFPVIIRKGINRLGREIVYMLNYSGESHMGYCPRGTYRELLLEKQYSTGETILLEGWGMAILEKEE